MMSYQQTSLCSVTGAGKYVECEGNMVTELGPKGYRGFIDSILLKNIPVEWIFTDSEVTHIDYSNRPIKVSL